MFNGRKWRENIMPQVRSFIRENDRSHARRAASA
ncbi:MAG TPA: hypothetical protein VEB20_13220 [Azospirillaceae bacterium]|nr:hypothetical protein [Azospirillaceae bacterium]